MRITKTCTFIKNYNHFIIIILIVAIYYFIYTKQFRAHTKVNNSVNEVTNEFAKKYAKKPLNIKYILLWTNPKNYPFIYLSEGRTAFIDRKCAKTNCYVTADRSFLGDYTEFDIIAFNGPELRTFLINNDLPSRRTDRQKYVYANIEAAATYPICDKSWNSYFNWTWTYRLDSDAKWTYFVIKDTNNKIIGPAKDINWTKHEDSIDYDLMKRLGSKNKAAAWFVSNCNTISRREEFVIGVQKYLRQFNLDVDIYGECGVYQCPKEIMSRCLKVLDRDYYFYFAFENALSEDYVTEKILHGLNHNTVPIVFGGANYSRFLPPDAYLDAKKLGVRGLVRKMYELIQNPYAYSSYFRWKKLYSYHLRHESSETDIYCKFCDMINDDTLFNEPFVWDDLDLWWTPQGSCKPVV